MTLTYSAWEHPSIEFTSHFLHEIHLNQWIHWIPVGIMHVDLEQLTNIQTWAGPTTCKVKWFAIQSRTMKHAEVEDQEVESKMFFFSSNLVLRPLLHWVSSLYKRLFFILFYRSGNPTLPQRIQFTWFKQIPWKTIYSINRFPTNCFNNKRKCLRWTFLSKYFGSCSAFNGGKFYMNTYFKSFLV